MNNPCKNCERKGCGVYHDKCTAYQAFVRENKAVSQKRQADAMYRGYLFYGMQRMKRLKPGNINKLK